MPKKYSKADDLIALIIFNIIAILITYALKTDFLVSMLLFLGVPCAYLLYRIPNWSIKFKIIFASIISACTFGFCFDFLAQLNGAWALGTASGNTFGKIYGIVEVSGVIWFVLWILQIFLFYEYFIDKPSKRGIVSAKFVATTIFGICAVVALLYTYNFFPETLHLPKIYLLLCIVVSLPMLVYAIIKPKLVAKALPVIFYFMFVYLSHELTALPLGQWVFSGDYLFQINVFGSVFPIEELVFWIILSSLIVCLYWELCFDDGE